MADNSVSIKLDVSEAITALKAVQREAKEATRALKELEGDVSESGKWVSDKEFKHSCRYLCITTGDGVNIKIDLGEPTGKLLKLKYEGIEGSRISGTHLEG